MKFHHGLVSTPPERSRTSDSSLGLVRKTLGSSSDSRQESRVRILIADDYAPMLSLIAELLGKHADVVGTVRDGEALLEAIGKLSPDVVVVDIGMPRLHGVEVAQRIRNLKARPRLVFLTVYEDPELVRAALSVGVLGYVVKCHVVTDLQLAIRTALKGQQFVSPCLQPIDLGQPSKRRCHDQESRRPQG